MNKVKVIRSKRRTLSLQIKNGELIARIPYGCSMEQLQSFIDSHRSWIEKNLERSDRDRETADREGSLSDAQIRQLSNEAKKDIVRRVQRYAPLVGVKCGRITIRCQKTRWGSCSAKGNLNFNCLLELCPEPVRDSVVVHELCHLKHMNHSKEFYAEVLRVFPEYRKWNQWLKEHGGAILRRVFS